MREGAVPEGQAGGEAETRKRERERERRLLTIK
jgi:hypothetical protein